MLRVIFKRRTRDNISGLQSEQFFSIHVDCMPVEQQLTRGGSGENGFDVVDLVGIEVVRDPSGVVDAMVEPVTSDLEQRYQELADVLSAKLRDITQRNARIEELENRVEELDASLEAAMDSD